MDGSLNIAEIGGSYTQTGIQNPPFRIVRHRGHSNTRVQGGQSPRSAFTVTSIGQKLDIDFHHKAGLCVAMPDDDDYNRRELINGLLLEAGRLMEDTSPEFAMRLPSYAAAIAARIDLLETTATDLQALAAAARTLLRGMPD